MKQYIKVTWYFGVALIMIEDFRSQLPDQYLLCKNKK